MKIYIDWDRREWFPDNEDIIDYAIDNGYLPTFSEWLELEYDGCLEDIFDLTEEEKKKIKQRYEDEIKETFEEQKKDYDFLTVLEVEAKEGFTVKEIL